mmetsp:Transcript_9954/g.31620  ORF Transcript_9954/g.31620 Transcript_9954/m.31620 type:complete len:288 (-) Transcript_9954:2284-3147(-)
MERLADLLLGVLAWRFPRAVLRLLPRAGLASLQCEDILRSLGPVVRRHLRLMAQVAGCGLHVEHVRRPRPLPVGVLVMLSGTFNLLRLAALPHVLDAAHEAGPVVVQIVDEDLCLAGGEDASVLGGHHKVLHPRRGLDALLARVPLLEEIPRDLVLRHAADVHGLVAVREGLQDAASELGRVCVTVPAQEADQLVLRVVVGIDERLEDDEPADVLPARGSGTGTSASLSHQLEALDEPHDAHRPQDLEHARGLSHVPVRHGFAPIDDRHHGAENAEDYQGEIEDVPG